MLILISTYDKKGEVFAAPVATTKPALAVRDFSEVCKDEKHPFNKFPEDYSLWIVGEFDETKGELIPKEPKMIAEAQHFVIKKENK